MSFILKIVRKLGSPFECFSSKSRWSENFQRL